MTGFEYELNKQRQQHAMSKAETIRQANASKPTTESLRNVIGRQLVKLGQRLQVDTQPTVSTRSTAYDSL